MDDESEPMRRIHTQAKLNKEQVINERNEYNKMELDKKASLAQLDTKLFNIKRETGDIKRENEGLTEQLEQLDENAKNLNAPWRAVQPPTSVSTTPARTTASVSTKFRVSTPESSVNAIASSSKVKQDGEEERASIIVNRQTQNTAEQTSKSIETDKSAKREIIVVESSPIRATEKRKITGIESDISSDGEYVVVHQPAKKRTKKGSTAKRYVVASSSSSSLPPASAPQADKKSGIKLPTRQLMGRAVPIFTPTSVPLKEFLFPRKSLNQHYGGKTQTWTIEIKADKSHNGRVIHCVFPQPPLNPLSVNGIGQPGLVFASRNDLFEHELWYVMRQVKVNKALVWEYCGGYHVFRDGVLTGKDFDNFPKTVRTGWGRRVLESKEKNSPPAYVDMYDRIQGRMKTQRPLTAVDVADAISNEDESINIIRMECVEYDEAFVQDMMRRFSTGAVAGPSPAKKVVKKKKKRSESPELGDSSTLARRSGRLVNQSLVYYQGEPEVEVASGSDFAESE